MKIIKNVVKICLLTVFVVNQVMAQQKGEFFDILYSAPKDASTFLNGYLSPILEGFGHDINTGWYSTAKPHQTLGFDLSFSTSLAFIPASKDYFNFKNSDYSNFELASGTEAKTPTIFGPDESTPSVNVIDHSADYGDITLASFNAPSGLGLKQHIGFAAIPAPLLQIGIGLIKHTDLKIRYVPDITNQLDYSYWGLGLMHDIGQWIPVVAKLPIDISVFGGFSKISMDYPTDPSQTGFDGSGQHIKSSITGYTIDLLVSKKIAVLTVLAGVGYNKFNSKFNINGKYDVDYSELASTWPAGYTPPNSTNNVLEYVDPIALSAKSGGLKATLGIRLQLAVFTINADYSLGSYNVLNTGIGLSFR